LKEAVKVLICCGCLGDRSDDANEIVECDGCGVTVHEGKEIYDLSFYSGEYEDGSFLVWCIM
jgi:hypothetical protein